MSRAVSAVFTVAEQEEDGWLRGRLHGNTGVFPSNFVRLSAAETDKPNCKIFMQIFFLLLVVWDISLHLMNVYCVKLSPILSAVVRTPVSWLCLLNVLMSVSVYVCKQAYLTSQTSELHQCFLPRDALLAQCMPSSYVCVCVCHTRRYCCYTLRLKLHRFNLPLYLLQTGLYNISTTNRPSGVWALSFKYLLITNVYQSV